VIEPLSPVPEPPRQVLDERQVQLDQLAADALPPFVSGRQRGELLEQLPGAPALPRGVLDPRGPQGDVHISVALELDDATDVDRTLDVDRSLDVHSVALIELH